MLEELVFRVRILASAINVILGKNNWVTIVVKEKNNDIEAMATAKLDDDVVADQSPRAYVQYLSQNTVPGNSEIIQTVTLQYTHEQNIIFSDTSDSDGKHLYYLNENFVTVMHELGHMWSFLLGINYHPHTPIPDRLQSFHTAEEYLTTSVRPYCEDNLDPLKIKRVGHGAREFKSFAEFVLEKESLIDVDVKARRQDACDSYLRGQVGKINDTGSNVKK